MHLGGELLKTNAGVYMVHIPYRASAGAADAIARIVAKGLGTPLGQAVVGDNKLGAGSILAVQETQPAAARRAHGGRAGH